MSCLNHWFFRAVLYIGEATIVTRDGVPGRARTSNLLIRSQVLYPIEPRVHDGQQYSVIWARDATVKSSTCKILQKRSVIIEMDGVVSDWELLICAAVMIIVSRARCCVAEETAFPAAQLGAGDSVRATMGLIPLTDITGA